MTQSPTLLDRLVLVTDYGKGACIIEELTRAKPQTTRRLLNDAYKATIDPDNIVQGFTVKIERTIRDAPKKNESSSPAAK